MSSRSLRSNLFWLSWTVFGNCADATTQYLAAVERMIHRSVDVMSQERALATVRAQNLPQQLSFLPSLSLQAREDTRNDFIASVSRRALIGTADLNLFRFGADLAGIDAASEEVRVQELTLEQTILRVENDAVRTLNAYIQARMESQMVEKILEARDQSLKLAEVRFQKGLISSQEVDKVQVDRNNALARLQDININVARSGGNLFELLGDTEVELTWPWKTFLLTETARLSKMQEPLLKNRPDWRTAEKRIQASDLRAKQGFSRMLPSIDLSASYGLVENEAGGSRSKGWEWMAGVTLTVPIFDRLANYSQYEVQIQARKSAEIDLERIRRRAKAELEANAKSLEIAVDSAKARDKTLEITKRLYDSSVQRFEKGLADANEIIVDQNRWLDSEIFAIAGWSGAHSALVRTCHSVGKRIKDCMAQDP